MELYYIISLVIGYLFGCISTAYIICRFAKDIDIREHGSGNAGTTNVIRTLGWKAGIYTFLGDFLKGVFAVLIMKYLFADYNNQAMVTVFTAAGVILGHNWPVFLNFKGGKGVASTLGLLFSINLLVGFIAALIMVVVILATRYVSLASILTALATPIVFLIFDDKKPYLVFAILLAILTIYKHKANVGRLLKGTESKIGKKKEG